MICQKKIQIHKLQIANNLRGEMLHVGQGGIMY